MAKTQNDIVPGEILLELFHMAGTGLNFKEAVSVVRDSLVPTGYTPFPYKRNSIENHTHKMRSLVATFMFRKEVRNKNPISYATQTYLRRMTDFMSDSQEEHRQ